MKIAVVSSRFPYPVEKGDKLRIFHQLKFLGRQHEVHLISIAHDPVDDKSLAIVNQFCASTLVLSMSRSRALGGALRSVLNGMPLQVGYFYAGHLRKKMVEQLARLQPDAIYTQLIRMGQYTRNLPYFKVLDYMDAFGYGIRHRASIAPIYKRPLLNLEARLTERYERRIYRDFDRHCIISGQDRNRLPVPYNGNIAVVPNGVDTQHFSRVNRAKRWDVAFVGNMGYAPNIEAAATLIKRILPKLWKVQPDVTVCIAGARPTAAVRGLACNRVTVTGWVPDIREIYSQCRIFVAPMRSGMGLQNKILEAMAMGCAVITTPIVNNAIGAGAGSELQVAKTDEELTQAIGRLLAEPIKREELGAAAEAFVQRHYSWDTRSAKLNQLFSKKTVREIGWVKEDTFDRTEAT